MISRFWPQYSDFNPRPPYGGRPEGAEYLSLFDTKFQSTPPIRGATLMYFMVICWIEHFNPRPPYGGRHEMEFTRTDDGKFQSTPPIRGATDRPAHDGHAASFQSTPPIRGATRRVIAVRLCRAISIHAPHTGGDFRRTSVTKVVKRFQSTPPIRGATLLLQQDSHKQAISIHAPHTGGDKTSQGGDLQRRHFNPRPPYGGRLASIRRGPNRSKFQSTPPIRGATPG